MLRFKNPHYFVNNIKKFLVGHFTMCIVTACLLIHLHQELVIIRSKASQLQMSPGFLRTQRQCLFLVSVVYTNWFAPRNGLLLGMESGAVFMLGWHVTTELHNQRWSFEAGPHCQLTVLPRLAWKFPSFCLSICKAGIIAAWHMPGSKLLIICYYEIERGPGDMAHLSRDFLFLQETQIPRIHICLAHNCL